MVRWHVGFYPTTLLENALLLTVAVFAGQSIVERRPPLIRSAFLWPAALFLVAGAIAVLSAPSRLAALGLFRAYMVEPVAFGWVLMNVVRTPGRALQVLGGLFAGAGVVGLANSWVVLQAIAGHSYSVIDTPPVVVYTTANAVALYVVPLTAMAGALGLHAGGPARKLGIAFFAIGVVVTTLSFSRGGYVALAAVVVGLAISHRRRALLLAAAAAGAIGLALVPQIQRRVVIELTNGGGATTASRLDLWWAAIQVIANRPFFGAGLSGFQARSAPYFSHAHTYAEFIDPHNIVLNFWIETGLLGVVAMGWIIGAGLVLTRRAWKIAEAAWRPYHLGVLLALVAVVVHGMVDVPYFKNDLSLEFWALLSLFAAGVAWSRESHEVEVEPATAEPAAG